MEVLNSDKWVQEVSVSDNAINKGWGVAMIYLRLVSLLMKNRNIRVVSLDVVQDAHVAV